jgi:hypothetical protein
LVRAIPDAVPVIPGHDAPIVELLPGGPELVSPVPAIDRSVLGTGPAMSAVDFPTTDVERTGPESDDAVAEVDDGVPRVFRGAPGFRDSGQSARVSPLYPIVSENAE